MNVVVYIYIDSNLDLSNYATKTDLKNATGVDRSNLAAKSNMPSFKSSKNKQKKRFDKKNDKKVVNTRVHNCIAYTFSLELIFLFLMISSKFY